jgi:hypothetical protein
MKAKITKVEFVKTYDTKHGEMFLHRVEYDGKEALYSSKKKDQNKFTAGQEAEFNEEKRTNKAGTGFLVIKPVYAQGGNSNYGRQLKREQSKYSGFAVSYVKDLIIAGKIDIGQWKDASKDICMFMVNLDKEIEK